jgi:hypothetical protein
VEPRINVVQHDLIDTILSCSSPEQNTKLDIHSLLRCIANMFAKLLSLYLLAATGLVVVQAGTSAS